MKAAPFAYERPSDLKAAIALMAEAKDAGKVIAGGQSLGPMLNLRLVQPELIIDIAGLTELKQAERSGDELVIGACITHGDIEDGRIPDVTRGAMQQVASAIAYRAVRNRGTIGGSLCHADPAADWVSALPALGAKVRLRGMNGPATLRSRSSSSAHWSRRCKRARSWRRCACRSCGLRPAGVMSRRVASRANSPTQSPP
jgi:Aerobic-type carbon monoxide dehydrogenase, middle subunit CoxM/CutM homologs